MEEEADRNAARAMPSFSVGGCASSGRNFDARNHGDGRGLHLFDDSDDESSVAGSTTSRSSSRLRRSASKQNDVMNRLSSSTNEYKESSLAEAERQLYGECTFQPNTARGGSNGTPRRRKKKKAQEQVLLIECAVNRVCY
jgi:hypothetical protein